jgi:hypothetical protein
MRPTPVSNERGIALAVAVFALVVIGALVAGTFFSGQLEQQTGQNTMYAMQAGEVAEAGLTDVVTTTKAAALIALPVAPSAPQAWTDFSFAGVPNVSAARTITRLTDKLFLVESMGARTDAAGTRLAVRSLGQLIRLYEAEIPIKAGLTALGNVKLAGGASVSGNDAIPPAWLQAVTDGEITCPPAESQAGVRFNLGSVSGSDQATGSPAILADPTLTAAKMKSDFDKLKVLATLTISSENPVAALPRYTGNPAKCDTSPLQQMNWGEPTLKTDPCFDYFPIIYRNGNLKLQGDRGQGVLLVEGDLTITGSMIFYGPVFVTGILSAAGNSTQGAKFYGGVIAGNVDLDDLTKITGGAVVDFSSCALQRALQNSATPGALSERSWVQLYKN